MLSQRNSPGGLAEERAYDGSPARTTHRASFFCLPKRIRTRSREPPTLNERRKPRTRWFRALSRDAARGDAIILQNSLSSRPLSARQTLFQNVTPNSREAESINRNSNRRLLSESHRSLARQEVRNCVGYERPAQRNTGVASAPLDSSTPSVLSGSSPGSGHESVALNPSSRRMTDDDCTLLHGDEVAKGLAKLVMKLDALVSASLFAGKYRITSEKIPQKPHCRYAIEQSTGQEVFLKFFPRRVQEFENAVKAHRALEAGRKHVCRLLDNMEDVDDFPPCLVLERGRYTLADRIAGRQMSVIERRAVLYSVLEALECIHARDIVHGNLDPSHIMWFSTDFSWKLIGFSKASYTGESDIQQGASRFVCPELARAVEHGHGQICLKPSMDMWSFGGIAFEVLTCSVVTDTTGVLEFLHRHLETSPVSTDRTANRWLSANRSGRVGRSLSEQNFQFVHSLLHRDPEERRTATEALEDGLFRSATDMYQRVNLFDEFASNYLSPVLDPGLQKCLFLQLIGNHLTRELDIELFAEDSDPSLPYYERASQEPLAFFDDYLEYDPVYILRLGDSFRLRIGFSYDPQLRMPIEKIASVVVKAPDAGEHALDVVQRVDDGSITAFAFFDPKQIDSHRLNSISPYFGLTDTKYVKVGIHTKVQLSDGFVRELDIYDYIYCKVVHPKSRLRLHKFLGMFVTKEERHFRQNRKLR